MRASQFLNMVKRMSHILWAFEENLAALWNISNHLLMDKCSEYIYTYKVTKLD